MSAPGPRVGRRCSIGSTPASPVLLCTRLAQHRGSVVGPNPVAGRFNPPTTAWLGRHSPDEAVRTSGQWRVTHTDHGVAEAAVVRFLDHHGAS